MKKKGKELFFDEIENKYKLLTEFKGIRKDIELKCLNCGNVFTTKPRYFTNHEYEGTRTGKCKKCIPDPRNRKDEFMKYMLKQKDYVLLNEYKTHRHLLFMYHKACETIYTVYPDKFKNKGQRCPYCFRVRKRKDKEFKEFVKKEGYTMLGKYKTNKTQVTLKHDSCGSVRDYTPVHFIFGSVRCEICSSSMSLGEKTIREFLEENNYKFKQEKSYSDLRYINRLRFDFHIYDEKKECLIEYHGRQHYESIDFFGGEDSFQERKLRDSLKERYCERKGIPLIIIPYTVKNIEETIEKELNKLGITNSLNT